MIDFNIHSEAKAEAKAEAIAWADAYLTNAALPSYSDLLSTINALRPPVPHHMILGPFCYWRCGLLGGRRPLMVCPVDSDGKPVWSEGQEASPDTQGSPFIISALRSSDPAR